jgi:hypothetical protein
VCIDAEDKWNQIVYKVEKGTALQKMKTEAAEYINRKKKEGESK